jgi:hypothetical protein
MSRKILNVPYEVEQVVNRQVAVVWEQLINPHHMNAERKENLCLALADMWKRGFQAKESFGFRWGLIIGAATGGLLLSIMHAIASAL